jgi:hypothetical protein
MIKLKKIRQEWKNIIFNAIFAGLILLLTILFYKKIVLASVLISLVTIISLIKWKSKINFLIFIFGAISGGIAEMIAIHFGVWNYTVTNFYNIPFWLLIVWGDAALYIYQTARELKKLGVEK